MCEVCLHFEKGPHSHTQWHRCGDEDSSLIHNMQHMAKYIKLPNLRESIKIELQTDFA